MYELLKQLLKEHEAANTHVSFLSWVVCRESDDDRCAKFIAYLTNPVKIETIKGPAIVLNMDLTEFRYCERSGWVYNMHLLLTEDVVCLENVFTGHYPVNTLTSRFKPRS